MSASMVLRMENESLCVTRPASGSPVSSDHHYINANVVMISWLPSLKR